MKNLKVALFILLFGVVGFYACQEETELFDEGEANFTEEVMNFHFNRGPRGPRCFELAFPVTVEFSDGSTEDAVDHESLKSIMMAWKDANPGDTVRPKIAFPHDIVLPSGDTVMVNDIDELREFTKDCQKRKRIPKPCYRLIYPLTLQFSDGSTADITNRREQHDAVKAWKESNPDDTVRPEILFPYDVELPNGESVTITAKDQLKELLINCRGRYVRKKVRQHCFKLAYPASVDFPDGTSSTFDTMEAMKDAIKAWVESNPDATDKPHVAFPHQVELKDGTIVTVNNEDEVKALIQECRTGN